MIETVLAGAAVRRRQRAALRGGLAAAAIGLAVLLAVAIAHLALPVPARIWQTATALALALPAVAAWHAWRRQADPLVTAAALDRAAGLDDALVTAAWFGGRAVAPETAAWVEAQRRRAEAAAAALDVHALCPLEPPRPLVRTCATLAALLAAVLLVPTSWSRPLVGIHDSQGARAAAAPDGAGEARAGTADAPAPLTREELLAAAEQALRPPEDRIGAAGPAAAEASSEPGGLAGGPRPGAGPEGEAPDVLGAGSPTDAARGEAVERRSAPDPAPGSLEDPLERAAERARRAAEEEATAAGRNAARRPAEPPSSAGDNAPGQGATRGAGDGGGPGAGADSTGAPAGTASAGTGTGSRQEGGVADSLRAWLDVTLRREVLASPFAEAGGSGEARLERPSEARPAPAPARGVAPAPGQQAAGAQPLDTVPWAYRELVRQYFLERARRASGGSR